MATLSGVWVFRDAPNLYVYNSDGYIWQNNLFATSNNEQILSIEINETNQGIYYRTQDVYLVVYEDNKWADEAYKILDFGEREALVTDEFYTWFTANAVGETAEEPEPEEPETVTQYLIREDSLIAIGDGFRSSRGTTKKYTLDEMAVLAAEKTSGGGSMFASTASGRIPEYEKGTALSVLSLSDLNFKSSATGALVEE